MVDLNKIRKIYFIGIGGIGMSALARYFLFHGKEVSGYDKTETILTKSLVREGIPVHYTEDLSLAPSDAGLIVYTPAIPKEHKELLFYQANKYPVLKRSQVLGAITKSSFNICVAGTHGKTTVSTMIAHLLRDSGYGCNAFLGGIAVNYNSNFWSDARNVCVIEADEYDRSFLQLSPDIAVVTAMDPDHLDIYHTAAAVEQAFLDFSGKLKMGGMLISKSGLSRDMDFKVDRHIRYSLKDKMSDAFADNIRIREGGYRFDFLTKNESIKDVELNMGGLHNVENAVAAISVAKQLEISDEKIVKAVGNFRGVKRRFEYRVFPREKSKPNMLVYIDDYAHHPEELSALIRSARNMFGERKCAVIFQPHLYSRTRDFVEGFAESLDLADEVVLLPIYPARELPISGITSGMIAEKMSHAKVHLMTKDEMLNWLQTSFMGQAKKQGWVLITAGAGDIDALVEPIQKIIEKTN
ncbi:MAG: UDP-N-acetylmuramate--L-alanine ligase [Bacteroidetes bacterium]|nr:MAG: UDP-N-acetylmuramate--L-alanine ligase [Bacteroidota bacterium]